MTRIIGIGNAGTTIVDELAKYKNFNIIKIDEGINVKKQKTPEEYEKNCPSFRKLFGKKKEDTYVFLSASGAISGLLLRVLEQLQGSKLHVVCLVSDPELLSAMGRLQQNLVQGVLKEYARSNLIEKLILIDNQKIEKIIGDVSLDEYYRRINEVITYYFYTRIFTINNKPTIETKAESDEISKITTLGLLNEKKEKSLFYDLRFVTQERYYYCISEDHMKENNKILQKIKKDLSSEDGLAKTFAIYKTDRTDNLVLFEASTHIVDQVTTSAEIDP